MEELNTDCPACDAPCGLSLLGILGNLAHFSCRYCGAECSQKITAEDAVMLQSLEDKVARNQLDND